MDDEYGGNGGLASPPLQRQQSGSFGLNVADAAAVDVAAEDVAVALDGEGSFADERLHLP